MNPFKSNLFAVLFPVFAPMLLGACSDDDGIAPGADELHVSGVEQEFTIAASDTGQISFTVESNREWQLAASGLEWAEVSPAGGAAGLVQVKITPYSNLGDLRTGTIAIRAGTQEHVITIHQQPSSDTPSIVVEGLTDGGVVCDAEGMPQSFRVNANVAWEAGTEDLGWAVVTPSKGAAGTSVRIVVTPEENDGAERSGTLIIRAATAERRIAVSQQRGVQTPVIAVEDLTDNYVRLAAGDAPVRFRVKSNYDWTVGREGTPDWIEITPAGGAAGETVTVEVKPAANAGDSRKGRFSITAVGAERSATETLSVVQAPAAGFDWVLFEDDFAWATTPSDAMFNVAAQDQGAGTALTDLYPKQADNTTDPLGMGCEILRGYTRAGCLKFGTANSKGRFTTPVFAEIEQQMDLTVTFRALTMRDYDAVLEIYCEAGTYETLDLRRVPVGSKWAGDPFQGWYDVTLTITGATRGCRLNIRSESDDNCCWYLDDLRITSLRSDAVTGIVMEPVKQITCVQKNVTVGPDGTFEVAVNHNTEVSVDPSPWITQLSASSAAFGSGRRTTYKFRASDNSTGAARAGKVRFYNDADGLSAEADVVQNVPSQPKSRVQWLLGADYLSDYETTWTTEHYVAAERGSSSARFSYLPGGVSETSPKWTFTGKDPVSCPNVTYAWTGDCWLFESPLDGLSAGARVQIGFVMIFGDKSPKYWMLEYQDDGVWKPVRNAETATVEDGTELTYNMAFQQDVYSKVVETVSLSASSPDGMARFRMRCLSGIMTRGAAASKPQNTGMRIVNVDGGGTECQPSVSIIE